MDSLEGSRMHDGTKIDILINVACTTSLHGIQCSSATQRAHFLCLVRMAPGQHQLLNHSMHSSI
jgi:hypothetical protein